MSSGQAAAGTTTVGVLGLGEAGGEISRDLLAAGAIVRGYDPAVSAPDGVIECTSDADAVTGVDLVLNLTSSDDAEGALLAAIPGLREGCIWGELNTSAAANKQRLAALAPPTVAFADVAIMSTVPGTGIRTPMIAAGEGALGFARLMVPLGARIEVIDEPVGAAATRKLLRSVFFKGLSAAVVEAILAARATGLEEWLHDHIAEVLAEADESVVDRIIDGTYRHARRREHEMRAAVSMLEDLSVKPYVSQASAAWLHLLVDEASRG